jgi:hypothetical protein
VIRTGALVASLLAVPPAASAEPRGVCFGAFAQISPVLAVFDYPADGHGPSEKSAVDFGLGGNVSVCWRWFEVGVGARYDYADAGDNAHFVAVPLWIGARIPVGASGTLRLAAGAGPGFGFVAGYPRGSTLVTFGPSAEASVGFIYRASPRYAISIEVGARFDVLGELNTDDAYLDGGELLHAQIPFVRAGATWR